MAIKNRVILAAGHGGGDNGAAAQGTTEAHETVQITNLTADILRKAGVEVVVVPHSLNLGATIDWINARYKRLNDGLAIEIHKNAGGGTGSEVWTPSYPDSTSRSNAKKIADALARATGQANRGVKFAQHNRWGRLGFTDDTNTYALLVEAGFIDVDPVSNSADAKYAEGIAKGVLKALGSKAPAPAPSKPAPAKASNETVAQQVIDGKFGNNPGRAEKLRAAGYDPATIQSIVNRKLGFGTVTVSDKKPVTSVVDMVIAGVFGNGSDREHNLLKAGHDPATVQAAVNARLGVKGAAPVNKAIVKGSRVKVTHPVDVNGTRLGVRGIYDVIQVNGNRIVIGKGSAVTAAVPRQNLKRV